MMSLEQAIEHAERAYKESRNGLQYALKRGETKFAERCKKEAEENRQLAAWLRELAGRRKAPEIVYCKDCRKHNVKVGFDENFHTVWKEDACPLVDWRGKAKEHEFDYQYCAFAERRTDV